MKSTACLLFSCFASSLRLLLLIFQMNIMKNQTWSIIFCIQTKPKTHPQHKIILGPI